ncbi:MAG: potassium channel family protein [Halobacteria archaeon]|nr:potassium channel family protein [Halobacteria archaeon]
MKLTRQRKKPAGFKKNIHEDQGRKDDADRMFRREMRARRKRRGSTLKRFFEWVIADLTSGYGTSWLRVIGVSFAIIALFTLVYFVNAAIRIYNSASPLGRVNGLNDVSLVYALADSFYFSAVTFTTLGYGDMSPVGVIKIASVLESLFGAIFMALLVAVFARKWMR